MKPGDHRVTLALFALVVGLMLVMNAYFPQELAIPLAGSDIRPVLLLEFASGPEHLVHIFGAPEDPLRAARIAGMNTGNWLDYLLMPAYGLFTLSFFFGIARTLESGWWRLAGWAALVAAFADAVENAIMFSMVSDMAGGAMGGPTWQFAVLPYPVWLKFALLALTCAAAALALARLRRWLLAALCLPAPLLIVPGMLDPLGIGPLATTMIGLGWLAMALYAASQWLRHGPRPVAAQSKE